MISDTMAALRGHIVDRLQPQGRIITRSTIEHGALNDPTLKSLRIKPRDVTSALRALCPDPLIQTIFPHLRGCPHAYSYGEPAPDERKRCGEAIAARHEVLKPTRVGDTNERYVRAVFRHVRERGAVQYGYIPNPAALGKMRLPGTNNPADLVLGYETTERSAINLFVEVKTHREHFDVTTPYLAKFLEIARDINRHDVYQPVLIVAHLTERARSFCKAAGIAVHDLGRRILLREERKAARELWQHADSLFQFVRIDRPFADAAYTDPRSRHDMEVFGQRAWIEEAHDKWLWLAPVRDCIVDALNQQDWDTIGALLPDYDSTA